MLEDFGDYGDERLLGLCAEDWLEPDLTAREESQRERTRLLEEGEVDDAWDRENERDLTDIVREHEETEDWGDEADDYLNCDFEE